jgi:hypothetical protein
VRPRSLSRRLLATVAVALAGMTGAAALFAVAAARQVPANAGMETFASGSMSVADSRGGAAIFDISNIGPGMTGQGEVTIGNTGTEQGALSLASLDRSDAPGLYGGALSERLELRVADVTADADAEVYAGELVAMPELQLGTLGPGETRTYRFSVSMRDGGPPASPYVDDNLYQRATASLGYDWTLTETEAGAEPPEPPEPASPVPVPPAAVPADGEAPPAEHLPRHRSRTGDAYPNSLVGTPGDDLIYGLGAADVILGRGGDDYLFGGSGSDRVSGGGGDDRLRGGVGSDRIAGGSGSDIVFARDGETDVIDCGTGSDLAYVDARDQARNCEAVHLHYARLFPRARPSG